MVSYHLMGIVLQLGVMETSGNRGYLMPLIIRFEVVKMKKFMLCVFHHNWGERGDQKELSGNFPNSQNLIHNRLNVKFQAMSHSMMSGLPHLETVSRFSGSTLERLVPKQDRPFEPHLNCNPVKSFSLPGTSPQISPHAL